MKVGPITVAYKGKAVFEEKDESARRAVIKASGKETRGQGNAAAVVTAELTKALADVAPAPVELPAQIGWLLGRRSG